MGVNCFIEITQKNLFNRIAFSSLMGKVFCEKTDVWSYILLLDLSKHGSCIFIMYVKEGVVYGTSMINAETNKPLAALEEGESTCIIFTASLCSCFTAAYSFSWMSGRLGQVPFFFLVSICQSHWSWSAHYPCCYSACDIYILKGESLRLRNHNKIDVAKQGAGSMGYLHTKTPVSRRQPTFCWPAASSRSKNYFLSLSFPFLNNSFGASHETLAFFLWMHSPPEINHFMFALPWR